MRKEKIQPILDDLYQWVLTIAAVPSSRLEKALNYLVNHREGLTDGRFELDNNRAERIYQGAGDESQELAVFNEFKGRQEFRDYFEYCEDGGNQSA
ncbi:MAG: IS66 family transposase [Lactobacillales bacterium]|nr:IS66 family transposase [Lactobacillales bacterium]